MYPDYMKKLLDTFKSSLEGQNFLSLHGRPWKGPKLTIFGHF